MLAFWRRVRQSSKVFSAKPQSGWASFEVPNGIRDGLLEAAFTDDNLQKIAVKW
jgi:hypothetical protein